jgi:hypothetical protein
MATGFLSDYLYTYSGILGSEGIGVRVAPNPLHLSAAEWYASQGFKGAVKAATVDGYEAIQVGTTFYVNGPSIQATRNYTNIYILSSSVGAGTETQNIFNQIIGNFRFAANRDGNGRLIWNDLNVCASDNAKACANDLDCANGACMVDRSKLRRDVKRAADIRLIAGAAGRYHDKNEIYPPLASGSYLAGRSVSVWPSWANEFASELGGKPPVDPVNKLAACPSGNGNSYEALTCWAQNSQSFACPSGSHVYQYYGNNLFGFSLNYNPEIVDLTANDCAAKGPENCSTDPLCILIAAACRSRVNAVDRCDDRVVGATAGICGNGVREADEDCEPLLTPTRTENCAGGTQVSTCQANCRWLAGSCQVARCGNGVKEGTEVCDQGSMNGTYGHCNAACTGIGLSCGDGVVQQGEVCDLGAQNGIWHENKSQSCAFDCHSNGLYCGDNKVTGPNEQCDGGTSSSNDPAVTGLAACGDIAIGGVSYKQIRTNVCNASCVWGGWGQCLPSGVCGNGKKESTEQCDNGGANSDTGNCLLSCKQATCGDGLVWVGNEQCDDGVKNINPSSPGAAAEIAEKRSNCGLASCYYCSNACTVKAVSGIYCGDGVINGTEQCDNGDRNVDPADAAAVGALPQGTGYCTTLCQSKVTPRCGDGVVNPGEQCDRGSANGTGGCSNACQCTTDEYVSDASALTSSSQDMSGAKNASELVNEWGWAPVLANAKWIWNFREGLTTTNPADVPADWGTADNVQYFSKTFTLNNPTAGATMQMTGDNYIDGIWIDGRSIMGETILPSKPIANYNTIYSVDITKYLQAGLTHTVVFRVGNQHLDGVVFTGGMFANPAGLLFKIISTPQCGGGELACGNGKIDPAEECDGTDLNGKNDCKSLGAMTEAPFLVMGDVFTIWMIVKFARSPLRVALLMANQAKGCPVSRSRLCVEQRRLLRPPPIHKVRILWLFRIIHC